MPVKRSSQELFWGVVRPPFGGMRMVQQSLSCGRLYPLGGSRPTEDEANPAIVVVLAAILIGLYVNAIRIIHSDDP